MEADIVAALTQFGAAGLIGWMWITERRAASARERQVGDVHERIMRERREMETLLEVVRQNTRALASLEAGQRAVIDAVERLARWTVGCGDGCEASGREAGSGDSRGGEGDRAA